MTPAIATDSSFSSSSSSSLSSPSPSSNSSSSALSSEKNMSDNNDNNSSPPTKSNPLSIDLVHSDNERDSGKTPSLPSPNESSSSSSSFPEISMDEFRTHNTSSSCWILVYGEVYDVTRWLSRHPGGSNALIAWGGKDATDVFTVFHSESVREMAKKFRIGKVSTWSQSEMQKDFHSILNLMENKGNKGKEGEGKGEGKYHHLLVTPTIFYVKAWAIVLSFILISCLLVYLSYFVTPSSFPLSFSPRVISLFRSFVILLSGLFLGLGLHQCAFLGHDYGHNSVGGSATSDLLGSLLVTCVFGVSGQWWKHNHNVHHCCTNDVVHDPDIQHLPFFAVSEKIFRSNSLISSFYQKIFHFDAVSKFFVRNQHITYYLAMAIARINLYIKSFQLILDFSRSVPHRWKELFCLLTYWTWFLFLIHSIPSTTDKYLFICIAHAVAGCVHVQITLSHFGMATFDQREISKENSTASAASPSSVSIPFPDGVPTDDFIITQFLSTLNVSCPPSHDWFHGGLHFQVDHHLFPRVPRPNLRELSTHLIRPFAAKYQLPYYAMPFLEANLFVAKSLENAAIKVRNLQ